MEKIVTVKYVGKWGVRFNDSTGAIKSDVPKDVKVGDRFYIKVNDNTNHVEKIVRV